MAKVRQSGNVQIVALSGDITIGKGELGRPLDLHGRLIEDVGETLDRLLSVAQPRIVVDLRDVRFLDSSGIGELVRWKKRAVKQRGDIRLLVGDGAVKRILSLMDLGTVFSVYDDESQAVASFGTG